MRALVSSGRSDLVSSWPMHLGRARCRRGAATLSTGALPPVAGAASKPVVRTVMTLFAILRLHRRERVAGVDRPHERVRRFDGDDLGDLRDVEQRRDARRRRSCRSRSPARGCAYSAPASDDDQRRDILRRRPARCGASACSTLATPATCAAACAARRGVVAGDEHMDVAADLLRGGDRVERRALERRVVVFGDDRMDMASWSRSPSLRCAAWRPAPSTSATLPPPLRFGGSTTFSVVSRGVDVDAERVRR